MKQSVQIGAAFVGLIVGGGFASGQEILQFFTSFGYKGLLGGIVASIGFMFLGMIILQFGYELKTTSHKEVVYHITNNFFGLFLDLFITIFLFIITVAMFAGTGAAFYQMFHLQPMIGSTIIAFIVFLTLTFDVKKIIQIIGVLTPYLVGIVLLLTLFAVFTVDAPISQLEQIAKAQKSAAPNWWTGALLYVSYNIGSSIAMLAVIGSSAKSKKVARFGGIFGGFLLGVLILLLNISMLTKMNHIQNTEMPVLKIAIELHPIIGIIMAFVLLCMIYTTAVGTLYAFVARIISPKQKGYIPVLCLTTLFALVASSIGFTTLVGKAYSAMGYLGFFIVFVLSLRFFKIKLV